MIGVPAAIVSGASGLAAGAGAGFSLGSLGSILGGLGSVGGLFGGKQKRGPSMDDMLKFQRRSIFQNLRSTVEAAKENGIHPLMALGSPASSPMSFSASAGGGGSNNFADFANAGADLARSIEAGQPTRMQQLQERLLTAQIEGQEIDNVSRASQVARTSQPGNPPLGVGLNERLADMPAGFGHATGVFPLSKVSFDEQGDPVRLFNEEDLGDNEMAAAWHFLRYGAPDVIHNKIGRPLARRIANTIRSARAGAKRSFGY